MCDDMTCEDVHLASLARMEDVTSDILTFDDLNPKFVRLWYLD